MKILMKATLIFALLCAARGSPDTGTLLTAETGAGPWKPLIDSLAANGTIRASFTEHRYFPFRRDAMTLVGVLRVSPDHGLSLQYTDPERNILIADPSGLLLKDSEGHRREMPAGSRAAGAIESLLPIMRFDLPALYPRFSVAAFGTSASWTFVFTPRDAEAASSLGAITISGASSQVLHLEFKKSSSQRVEIDVGSTETHVSLSADELKEYFR